MEHITTEIEVNGFCKVSNKSYEFDSESLFDFQESYFKLSKDQSHGERYRSYSKYELVNDDLSLVNTSFYAQSAEYNNEDGGKPRIFNPINTNVLNGDFLKNLIKQNIAIAKITNEIDFSKKVNIGLHQIRYCGSSNKPSYSSPLWLHKDDENLVFIHLLNLTANANGGDNLLAYNPRKIDKLIRLVNPLDTLLITKKHLHTVTPVGSSNDAMAYRDILLVTFDNEEDIVNRVSTRKVA